MNNNLNNLNTAGSVITSGASLISNANPNNNSAKISNLAALLPTLPNPENPVLPPNSNPNLNPISNHPNLPNMNTSDHGIFSDKSSNSSISPTNKNLNLPNLNLFPNLASQLEKMSKTNLKRKMNDNLAFLPNLYNLQNKKNNFLNPVTTQSPLTGLKNLPNLTANNALLQEPSFRPFQQKNPGPFEYVMEAPRSLKQQNDCPPMSYINKGK